MTGFGEESRESFARIKLHRYEKVKLDAAGRLVIPADMREAMGVKSGDTLMLHVEEDGELRIIGQMQSLRRLQRYAQQFKKPGESVVDEFLAEKRAAWRED